MLRCNVRTDYETKSTYDIDITATDSGSLTVTQSFTIQILNYIEPPTNIFVSASSFYENVSIGTLVANLTATPGDSDITHFTLVNTSPILEIANSNELRTKALVNYEDADAPTNNAYFAQIRVHDSNNRYYTKIFFISVLNANDTPEVLNTITVSYTHLTLPTKA